MILGVSRRSSREVWLLSGKVTNDKYASLQSRVGEMGWDAINIRLSYCRHLPSLQLLPPHIRNHPPPPPPPLHTDILYSPLVILLLLTMWLESD